MGRGEKKKEGKVGRGWKGGRGRGFDFFSFSFSTLLNQFSKTFLNLHNYF
jgi:hypothetical protein